MSDATLNLRSAFSSFCSLRYNFQYCSLLLVCIWLKILCSKHYINCITILMQLNSLGEINTPSASQEIYWILWNPDIYCVFTRSHTLPKLVLSQINPFHISSIMRKQKITGDLLHGGCGHTFLMTLYLLLNIMTNPGRRR